jgi:hypothetical protein
MQTLKKTTEKEQLGSPLYLQIQYGHQTNNSHATKKTISRALDFGLEQVSHC